MYQIREKAMEMALKWAECQIDEVDHEALLKVAQDIESYLEGTWGEPGGCCSVNSKESVKSRADRIREALTENDSIEIYTVTVPEGVRGFTNLGEWLRSMNTTQEQD